MASWSKVTVKTLDQNTYEVDASGLKTVSEFKAKLETILGPDTIPADSMRIINNGQIMSDDNALLGDLKVDLKKPFLVMMTRAKTAPVSALPPVPNAEKSPMTRSEPLGQRSHLIQGQVTTSGNSVSEPTYSRSTERQRESYIRAFKVMQQGSSGIRDNSDTSVSVTGQGTTSQPDTSVEASVDNADPPLIVQALMAMGFDRAPVESALRMTEGDPDRALELLLNGALFMDDTTALGDLLSLHPPDAAFLQLVQEPYMNTLRERVQREGPDVLTDALRIVALQNTQAIEIIHANQDIFVDWLNGMDPSHTPQRNVPPFIVILSEHDQDVIRKLSSMGFPSERVIEAYLACDRDENMAIELLITSFHDALDSHSSSSTSPLPNTVPTRNQKENGGGKSNGGNLRPEDNEKKNKPEKADLPGKNESKEQKEDSSKKSN